MWGWVSGFKSACWLYLLTGPSALRPGRAQRPPKSLPRETDRSAPHPPLLRVGPAGTPQTSSPTTDGARPGRTEQRWGSARNPLPLHLVEEAQESGRIGQRLTHPQGPDWTGAQHPGWAWESRLSSATSYAEVWGQGAEGRPPRNVPLWRVDYFEPKTIKAQGTRKAIDLPLHCPGEFKQGSIPGRQLFPKVTVFT